MNFIMMYTIVIMHKLLNDYELGFITLSRMIRGIVHDDKTIGRSGL